MKYLIFASLLVASGLAQATTQLRILTEYKSPVAGAQVIVGTASGTPFPGNVLTTDGNGYVQVPDAWNTALPITVKAPQFITTTFTNRLPTAADLQIHAEDPVQMVQVSGETIDFGNLPKDGLVDFGLVIPAMPKRRLMQFNVAEMISSEVDTIKVITSTVNIPSNVTLPYQKESYILPITLDKPSYRMQVRPNEDHRMTAIHGQFPIKKVVDALRAGTGFMAVVNDFKFFGAGQTDVSAATANIPGQNISVNQITFDSTFPFTAPTYAADQTLFSAALAEQNGLFYPTDVKRLNPGETRDLQSLSSADSRIVVSVAIPKAAPTPLDIFRRFNEAPTLKNFDTAFRQLLQAFSASLAANASGMSLVITEAGTPGAPTLLETVPAPVVQANRLVLQAPSPSAAVIPVATYVSLSRIETTVVANRNLEKRFRLLEFFADGWTNGVDIPDLTNIIQAGQKYRWEVMYLGRSRTITPSPNDYFLDEITHVSRNTYNF